MRNFRFSVPIRLAVADSGRRGGGILALAVLGLALILTGGCRIERVDPDRERLELEPDPEFVMSEPLEMEELQEQVRRLHRFAREFPARGEVEHHALVRETLQIMLRTIPTLRGPQADGAFVQQLRMMDQSQRQLHPESPFLPTDVTVTMALRAAYNALISTAIAGFADDEMVEQHLSDMRNSVEELDRVRGPIHRLVAGEAVRHAADAMFRMTAILAEEVETPSPGEVEFEER